MGMKFKKLRKFVKDSYGRIYGIDYSGTSWRLDKLDAKGISYKVI